MKIKISKKKKIIVACILTTVMIFACNKYVNKPGEGSDQAMQIVLDHIKNDIPSNEISSDVGTYIQQGDNTLESFDM